MLKKEHRLTKTVDIKRVFGKGRGFFSTHFSIKHFNKSNRLNFAIIISTKVSKKAVVRNRLKRIIREFIRYNTTRFLIGDYTITVKPFNPNTTEQSLLKDLENSLTKAKLIS